MKVRLAGSVQSWTLLTQRLRRESAEPWTSRRQHPLFFSREGLRSQCGRYRSWGRREASKTTVGTACVVFPSSVIRSVSNQLRHTGIFYIRPLLALTRLASLLVMFLTSSPFAIASWGSERTTACSGLAENITYHSNAFANWSYC